MMETPDAIERQRALDIAGSFIVEAPAGSGKTGLLMQRFLKLLGEAAIDKPEQILAITFTRKAAAEMKARILRALQTAADSPAVPMAPEFERLTHALALRVLERSEQMDWDLLHQPQRLNITTIDSFCMEIVYRLPLLSGGGELQPVESPQALYMEAAQRTMRELGGGDAELNAALQTFLLHRNGQMNQCANFIAEMLQWRDQWLRHLPLGPVSANRLEEWRAQAEHMLQSIVLGHLNTLGKLIDTAMLEEISELAHIAAINLKAAEKPVKSPAWLADALPPKCDEASLPKWRGILNLLLTGEYEWRKERGITATIGFKAKTPENLRMKNLLAQIQSLDVDEVEQMRRALEEVETLPPCRYDETQWQMACALFRVLPMACAQLNVLFAEKRQCDFTAISISAVHALQRDRECNELALAIGTRIQHLLVDEMQDTSVTHFELLKAITSSWDGISQTIFLVGDPKQSIYLFREARVELFRNAMKHGLGDIPLQVLTLTSNFRSQAKLVEAFNVDFEAVLADEYTASSATKPATDGDRHWHIATFDKEHGETSQDCEAAQAEEISASIAEVLSAARRDDIAAPTIAILVRNRNHATDVLTALRARDIPYTATALDALHLQPEIIDIAALTRALIHPGDRTAWLALLRAPWCGLTLASLLTLTETLNTNTPLIEDIERNAEKLSAGERERLQRAWRVLGPAHAMVGHIALPELVERTWISLGGAGLAEAYARPDKPAEAVMQNIESYLRLLDTMCAEHDTVDGAMLDAKLADLKANTAQSNAAVQIVTIHKAKGLEWDHVYVPALHRIGTQDRQRLLDWYEFAADATHDEFALLAPVPVRSAGKNTDGHRLANWIRRFKQARSYDELKRLFYVACTRAKQQLHLYAVTQRKDDYSPAKASLLHAAWPASQQNHPGDSAAHAALALAAEAAAGMQIRRIMRDIDPVAEFVKASTKGEPPAEDTSLPTSVVQGSTAALRPEAGLAARAMGNVVHGWMQRMAENISAGATIAQAQALIAASENILKAQLRQEGAPAQQLNALAERTATALTNTLQDAAGQWLLAAHGGGQTEFALSFLRENRAMQLRVDRIFMAGEAAHSTGESHVWIADFKTSEPHEESVDAFLLRERDVYRRQLEGYAQAIRWWHGEAKPIRLALYYPLLPALDWWEF